MSDQPIITPEDPDAVETPPPADYDYPWVVAWGRLIAMTEEQTARMVDRARGEQAPRNAIYKYSDLDSWHTLDEVMRVSTRHWLMSYAQTFDLVIPEEVMNHWLDPDYRPPQEPPWANLTA